MFVGIGLNLVRGGGSASPASLFAAGEPGVWYDPSDLTTLFTDSAGTIPVTAPNQTVGKMLDKSGRGNHATQATSGQRPTYGINPITGTRNLLTYTEQFDNAVWTKTNATVLSNATADPFGGSTADILVEDATTGVHTFKTSTVVGSPAQHTFSCYFRAGVRTWGALNFVGQSDAFAYYNLSNGTLGTVAASATASITNVGGGWYRATITATLTAARVLEIYASSVNEGASYPGTNGTQALSVWGAQLELGSTATAYQKVVTQYEVTQAGVASASYLAFDGTDDSMVTGTITPAIDKVQVFAGVRKLSDAAVGIVAETSINSGLNAGTIYLIAPESTGVSGDFRFKSRGSVDAGPPTSGTYLAPTTRVLTGLGDISSDTAILRINGTQVAAATTDQGTGNFLAYPLYIGRRGGSTLPYNGRIYSLITRFGANLTTGQITSTESWVNGKTGAY